MAAAEASARVSEAMTGAGDEMENISRSIERAKEDTKDMEARAAAMDELEESGALEGALSDGDQIDQELEEMRREGEVETELETLKAETGDGVEASADGNPDVDVETDTNPEIEAELEDLKEEEESADAEGATEGAAESATEGADEE